MLFDSFVCLCGDFNARTGGLHDELEHKHVHIHAHTAEPFRLALCDGSVAPNRDGPFRWRQWASLLHSNNARAIRFPRFCVFFA